MTLVWVMLGGALGAGARFLLGTRVQLLTDGQLPWGTLTVNVLGCLAIGALVEGITAGRLPPELRAPLVTGFLGAFTTWSAFGYDTWELFAGGLQGIALAYVAATFVLCLGAVALGVGLARVLVSG
jgi:CrcB protein